MACTLCRDIENTGMQSMRVKTDIGSRGLNKADSDSSIDDLQKEMSS